MMAFDVVVAAIGLLLFLLAMDAINGGPSKGGRP